MYEKDKRQRVTVRLNDEQFSCVNSKAEILGISPSEFIRMLINSLIFTERKYGKSESLLDDSNPSGILEVLGRENDKTDINH